VSLYRFDRERLLASAPGAFVCPRVVRFQDVDAAGIIFFARAFEYFHDAYVEFLEANGCALPDALRERSWAAPLRHAEADYLRPLRFGDRIEVALVAAHVEPSEVTIGYRVTREASEETAVVGQCVHTFIDPERFVRRAMPDEMRKLFESLAGSG
jgi:1,4-dihydroxy-2-naphthoyl-CoA hydrolase